MHPTPKASCAPVALPGLSACPGNCDLLPVTTDGPSLARVVWFTLRFAQLPSPHNDPGSIVCQHAFLGWAVAKESETSTTCKSIWIQWLLPQVSTCGCVHWVPRKVAFD